MKTEKYAVKQMSLTEARKLYYSENNNDKQIALYFFKQEELEYSVKEILELTDGNIVKASAITIIEHLAEFFNQGWKKTANNTGFFIGLGSKCLASQTTYKDFMIGKHDSVMYAGITYFKDKEDIKKVIDMFDCSTLF